MLELDSDIEPCDLAGVLDDLCILAQDGSDISILLKLLHLTSNCRFLIVCLSVSESLAPRCSIL